MVIVVAGDDRLGARVVVVAQQVDLGDELGQLELDPLVVGERLAEGLALAQVLDGALERERACCRRAM